MKWRREKNEPVVIQACRPVSPPLYNEGTHLDHIVQGDSIYSLENSVGGLVRCSGQSLSANLLQQDLRALDRHQVLRLHLVPMQRRQTQMSQEHNFTSMSRFTRWTHFALVMSASDTFPSATPLTWAIAALITYTEDGNKHKFSEMLILASCCTFELQLHEWISQLPLLQSQLVWWCRSQTGQSQSMRY